MTLIRRAFRMRAWGSSDCRGGRRVRGGVDGSVSWSLKREVWRIDWHVCIVNALCQEVRHVTLPSGPCMAGRITASTRHMMQLLINTGGGRRERQR